MTQSRKAMMILEELHDAELCVVIEGYHKMKYDGQLLHDPMNESELSWSSIVRKMCALMGINTDIHICETILLAEITRRYLKSVRG